MEKINKLNSEELSQHFWYLSSIFRGTMSSEQASIYILSLIFLKRLCDNSPKIFNMSLNEDWKNLVQLAVSNNNSGLEENLIRVFYLLDKGNNLLDGISGYLNFRGLGAEIKHAIIYLDKFYFTFSSEIIGMAFSYFINESFSNYRTGFDITPPALVKLIVKLISPKKGEKLYDPAIGTGSFFVEASNYIGVNPDDPEEITFYGQEINPGAYSICKMNLIMNGIYNFNISSGDVISTPCHIKDGYLMQFDKILSHIPFNLQIRNKLLDDRYNRFRYGIPPAGRGDFAFIQHIISSCKRDGLAAIITSPSIMFSNTKSEKFIKEQIIKEDLLDGIIFLPAKILYSTQISPVILILSKNKPEKRKNKIIFIDLRESFVKYSRNKNMLSEEIIEQIVEKYREYKEEKNFSRIVTLSEIEENDYSLDATKYSDFLVDFKTDLSAESKRLKDVAECIRGQYLNNTPEDKNGMPYIKISELKEDILSTNLVTNVMDKRKVLNNKSILSRKAIIIALVGNKLKPTIFDPEQSDMKEIILSNNTLAIIPDDKLIDTDYLYYRLYSPEVLKQFELIQNGVMRNIHQKGIENIIIVVPSFKAQKQYIRDMKSSLLEIEKLRHKERILTLEARDSSVESEKSLFSIISHNMRPELNEMQMRLFILEKYLREKELMEDFCRKDMKLEELVHNLNRNLSNAQNILNKTREIIELTINDCDFERINLSIFFKELNKNFSEHSGGRYSVKFKSPRIFLKLHKFSFEQLFARLIENAEIHGFDFTNEDRKYKIDISAEENTSVGTVEIIYKNNGKPFLLSKENYITPLKKGIESKGSGLGGYVVYRVVKAHGGDLNIISADEGMELHITIPKIGDEYEE